MDTSVTFANKLAVVERPVAVDECPVAIDECPVTNDDVVNAVVVAIERNLNPRAAGGVGGADVINDIIVQGSSRVQTRTGDDSSSVSPDNSMMSFTDFIF